MNSKTGFLLSTGIVYVTLVIVIMATAIRLSVLILPHAYHLMGWCDTTDFYTACDLLYKDFCAAPIAEDSWYKADKDGFIWHTGSKDIGWLIVDNKLIYKEGIYNKKTHTWSAAATSLITKNVYIQNVDFLAKSGSIQEITCLVHKQNFHYRWYCRKVYNGVV